MKNISIITTLLLFSGLSGANAYDAHIYANNITAHNIITIQHTITNTALSSFGGSMATGLGKTATKIEPFAPQSSEDPKTTYGHAPIYGTEPLYGEYNADGRSGGDMLNPDAMLTGTWLNWHHGRDYANFDNAARYLSNTDIFTFGISGGQTKLWNGTSKWGMYAGYVGGSQKDSEIKLTENGGFFGIYNGNKFGNLNVYAILNGGVLNNSADTTFGTDEFTNFWLSGMIRTTYAIALDDTFSLVPGLNIGYTWIKSENYTSASGDILTNDSFGTFEISPSLHAIKHIGNGWHGSLSVAYVMNTGDGGDISTGGTQIALPQVDDFIEYGISLEKSVKGFTFTGNFARRDGGRDGWIGGLNIKYAF